MSKSFGRRVDLTVGNYRLSNSASNKVGALTHRIVFNVEKTDTAIPNNVRVVIYNLNEDERANLSQASNKKEINVILKAGYIDQLSTIFTGDLNYCRHYFEAPNWVTTIEAGDAYVRFRTSRISGSEGTFPPGTTVKTVLQTLMKKAGFTDGNIEKNISQFNLRNLANSFKNGKVTVGLVSDEIGKLMKSLGKDWSVQDGSMYGYGPNEVINVDGRTPYFSKDTGLIGNPQPGELGVIELKILLEGGLIPGMKIEIESPTVYGEYKIRTIRHYGDTHGQDWYSDIRTTPLGMK
jgi:hypothetical protein